MLHREGAHGEVGRVKEHPARHRDQLHRHGRLGAAQHYLEQQVVNAVKRGSAAVDLQLLDGLPAHERGEQPAEAQDVVEVSVGDEDAVEPLEAYPRLQDLPLRALAAVHQEAVLVVLHQVGGQVAFGGGG